MQTTKNNSEKENSKIYYDKTNKVAVVQWYDNKIVTIVSTLGVVDKISVYHRKGSYILELTI